MIFEASEKHLDYSSFYALKGCTICTAQSSGEHKSHRAGHTGTAPMPPCKARLRTEEFKVLCREDNAHGRLLQQVTGARGAIAASHVGAVRPCPLLCDLRTDVIEGCLRPTRPASGQILSHCATLMTPLSCTFLLHIHLISASLRLSRHSFASSPVTIMITNRESPWQAAFETGAF